MKNLKIFENKKILFLGAHPDDVELGCGGTISRILEEKGDVYYAVFSKCEKSIPEGFEKDILERELYKAAYKLGIKKEKIIFFDFQVRDFPKNRQDILENLVKIKKEINPDIIFIPSSFDNHQDHMVINREGIRAFGQKTIFGYELPWTNRSFAYSAFVNLEDSNIEKKIASSRCYVSQARKKYMDPDFLMGWARMRGMQSNSKYAEAFETIQLTIN